MKTSTEELERAVRSLIDAALAFDALRAQAELTADALRRFAAPKPRSRAKTKAALAEIAAGAPVAPTARKYGIQPSTLFRARAKLREAAQAVTEAAERPSAPTPSQAGRRSEP